MLLAPTYAAAAPPQQPKKRLKRDDSSGLSGEDDPIDGEHSDVVLRVPREWLSRMQTHADETEAENARLRDQLYAERLKRARAEKQAKMVAAALERQARVNHKAARTLRKEMERLRQRQSELDPMQLLQARLDALSLSFELLEPPSASSSKSPSPGRARSATWSARRPSSRISARSGTTTPTRGAPRGRAKAAVCW